MSQEAHNPRTAATAQLVALRLVIASSFINVVLMGLDPRNGISTWLPGSVSPLQVPVWAFLPPMPLIIIHHVGSTFGPTLFPIKRWIDITLTLLEVGFSWFATVFYMGSTYVISYTTSQPMLTLVTASQFTLALGLSFLFILRVIAWWKSSGKRWSAALDMIQVSQNSWWQYPVTTILGRRLWRSAMPGEAGWISIVRGIAALLVVTVMIAFAAYAIVMSPVAEMESIPQRRYLAQKYDLLHFELLLKREWNVIVMGEGSFVSEVAAKSINVSRSFDDNGKVICKDRLSDPYNCQNQICYQTKPDWQTWAVVPTPFGPKAVHIHINFTDWFPEHWNEPNPTGSLSGAAHVYVGQEDTQGLVDEIIRVQKSYIHMLPGTHQWSFIKPTIERVIKTPGLGSQGIENYDSYLVFNPTQIMPNPSANIGDPNVATLTVVMDEAYSWLEVHEDFREKSVLTGLTAVGGLGSLLSTMFVILLGTSLMRATMQTKESSPLGLLHTGMDDKLTQACKEKYPGLEADIERFRRDPGLVMYLFDTLVAMGPLEHLEDKVREVAEPNEPTRLEEDVEAVAIRNGGGNLS